MTGWPVPLLHRNVATNQQSNQPQTNPANYSSSLQLKCKIHSAAHALRALPQATSLAGPTLPALAQAGAVSLLPGPKQAGWS